MKKGGDKNVIFRKMPNSMSLFRLLSIHVSIYTPFGSLLNIRSLKVDVFNFGDREKVQMKVVQYFTSYKNL